MIWMVGVTVVSHMRQRETEKQRDREAEKQRARQRHKEKNVEHRRLLCMFLEGTSDV